jgi:hypothetical protein
MKNVNLRNEVREEKANHKKKELNKGRGERSW